MVDTPEAEKFDVEKVPTRHFLIPDQAAEFGALISALTANVPDLVKTNFDMNAPFPDGFDGMILPLSKQEEVGGETKNVVKVVVIAKVPSFTALNAHPKGPDFVQEAVMAKFATKLGSAFRPRTDGKGGASVPASIEDFIENRREASAEAWKKIGPVLTVALKKKGLHTITQAILRKCLASTPFSSATYPTVPQNQWQNILAVGKALAAKLQVAGEIFDHWMANRDQASADVTDVSDLSLDLDKLVVAATPKPVTGTQAAAA